MSTTNQKPDNGFTRVVKKVVKAIKNTPYRIKVYFHNRTLLRREHLMDNMPIERAIKITAKEIIKDARQGGGSHFVISDKPIGSLYKNYHLVNLLWMLNEPPTKAIVALSRLTRAGMGLGIQLHIIKHVSEAKGVTLKWVFDKVAEENAGEDNEYKGNVYIRGASHHEPS